jgi:hypothetical protein
MEITETSGSPRGVLAGEHRLPETDDSRVASAVIAPLAPHLVSCMWYHDTTYMCQSIGASQGWGGLRTFVEAALAHASGYELRNAFVNGIYPSSPPFLRLLANCFCECTLA